MLKQMHKNLKVAENGHWVHQTVLDMKGGTLIFPGTYLREILPKEGQLATGPEGTIVLEYPCE